MSRHRNPICQTSGKVRYRERRDVKFALRRADGHRSKARMNDVSCDHRETSGYDCADCGGWHLTSQTTQTAQPNRPVQVAPRAKFTVRTPGPAAEAIRHMAMANGLPVGAAA